MKKNRLEFLKNRPVQFGFISLKPKKTKPNQTQTRKNRAKPNQTGKNRAGRFEPVVFPK
jgi:hypothetical protein